MRRGSSKGGRSFPLRAHLLFLVVGTLLPTLALSAVLARRVMRDRRDAVRSQLLEAARAEATIIDSELLGTIRALRALAESDTLRSGDLDAFRDEAARVTSTQPSWSDVVLHQPDGVAITNVAKSFGGVVPSLLEGDVLAKLVATGEPLIGNLGGGSDFGEQLAFPVHVPVMRDGRAVYILSAVITPDRLANLLRGQNALSDEWVRGVVDTNGVLVARTRDGGRFVGQKGTPEFLKRYSAANEDVYRDTTLEGVPVYGAFSRAPMSQWIAGVAVPAALVDSSFQQSLLVASSFGVLLLVIGLAGAFEISRRLSRDIARAAGAADSIARGHQPRVHWSPVSEVERLSDALVRSADLLDARQRERDEQVTRADLARQDAEAARIEAENARLEAEKARVAAEEADSAKDDFLAMLGHELRNPLAPVLTALELMRLRGESASQRERDIIERQVKHLMRLVEDLFDVSRLRRGRVELRRRPFEIIGSIEKAVEISSPLLSDRRHKLTIDVSVVGLVVDGDETRLAQVFANLLTNASNYSNRPGHIILRGSLEAGMVVVRCQDDGMGMGPELLPRVFELFKQGQQSLDRRKGGLGLGLAVAKTLVELHGGVIEAASDGPGRGSTFTVRLPLASSPASMDRPDRERAAARPLGGRVLVVDDNRDAADLLAETLRFGGFEVRTAFDGAEALKALHSFRADVAILDIGLPTMNGLELARQLRHTDATRTIRLIALTGYGQQADFTASSAAGFDVHLVKPVTTDALFAAVHPRRQAPATG
jgi:signal transduction histidine kinase/ActR/RegA family two-component response regulator